MLLKTKLKYYNILCKSFSTDINQNEPALYHIHIETPLRFSEPSISINAINALAETTTFTIDEVENKSDRPYEVSDILHQKIILEKLKFIISAYSCSDFFIKTNLTGSVNGKTSKIEIERFFDSKVDCVVIRQGKLIMDSGLLDETLADAIIPEGSLRQIYLLHGYLYMLMVISQHVANTQVEEKDLFSQNDLEFYLQAHETLASESIFLFKNITIKFFTEGN